MFGYKTIEYNGKKTTCFQRNDMKEWMVKNYTKFNYLYFDDILPPVDDKRILLVPINRKYNQYLGIAYNQKPYKIKINFRYDLPEIEWMNVLLHEMIHIWQYVIGYKGGHGKTFTNKAETINKYGWGITTTYKNIIRELNDVE